ncbi:MAG: aminomethyltransferase family protein, partial [Verrucomicrobiales bacterium]|nr:aminomethyltransferase family protein [Verrucomicrobiales bacterium]
ITYVGELGWELYPRPEDAEILYRRLADAGADLGVADAGHYAIQSLRLEKGYRAFGAELSPDESPLEAGLSFTVAWDKPGGFLGREALLRRRANGPTKRLALLALESPEPILWGAEPVFRDGQPAGYTTSAGYGHTVGASVALAYIRLPGSAPISREQVLQARYDIEVDGEQCPARVSLEPWYDPRRLRVLA